MHSEYLRRLYLNNDLAEGHFEVEGKLVTLKDIHVPLFAVSRRNSEPQFSMTGVETKRRKIVEKTCILEDGFWVPIARPRLTPDVQWS